jgi:hypothetical protein
VNQKESKLCRNCGESSIGRYCPNCGQRKAIYKVTFRETIQDFVDAVFTVNAPLFMTLKGLFVHPGKLLLEFLEGQRKKYYKPVAFFLLTTVVYLVIRSLIGFNPFGNTLIQVQDGAETGRLLTEARNYMLLNINNLLFIFVFTLALFSKLFFYKKQTLAEFLAISFYMTGVYTLIVTLNMFLIQYVSLQLQPLAVVVMCVYYLYAMISFFHKPKFIILLKSIVLYFLAFISYGLLGFGLSFLIVYSKQL